MICGVPIRSFAGFRRLGLDVETRRRLARRLAGRVVTAGRDAGCVVVVVTDDPDVAAWARSSDLEVLDPGAPGLDAAARALVERAGDEPWLVLHADLPAIDAADVAAVGEDPPAIAPSLDGGTSAISGRGPFPFAYGDGSFARHLARLGATARVVVRPGLAFDLDRPRHLAAARRLGMLP